MPTALLETVKSNVVLSMRDKLHVPLGWCCSGWRAKEYTLIPTAGTLVWCWNGWTSLKYRPSRTWNRSWPLSWRRAVMTGFFPAIPSNRVTEYPDSRTDRSHQSEKLNGC